MSKYITIYKLAFARILTYRVDFLLSRIRGIVLVLFLYFFWFALTKDSGRFANFNSSELFTYVFGVFLFKEVVFGSQTRRVVNEINRGELVKFLVKPINYWFYTYSRQIAERTLALFSAIIELVILFLVLKVNLIIQSNLILLGWFLLAIILAHILYFILSLLISFLAFWSREAMGPRFLYEWTLEFCSGAYFPLSILSKTLFIGLAFLPFAYLIYGPLGIYLGWFNSYQIITIICIQIVFIIFFTTLTYLTWKKGLRRYSGQGI